MSSARGLMNMPNVQTSGIYFTYREEGVKKSQASVDVIYGSPEREASF